MSLIKRVPKWFEKNKSSLAFIGGTIFLICTFLMFYFENVYEKLDYKAFGMLLIFVIAIYACLLIAVRSMVSVVLSYGDDWTMGQMKKVTSEIEVLLSKIKGIEEIKELVDDKIIINDKKLVEIERDIYLGEHIWISTSLLDMEDEPEFRDAIVKNLLDGVTYTYLIPNDEDIIGKMQRHTDTWVKMSIEQNPKIGEDVIRERVRCIIVPQHFPYMTVLIYNANSDQPEIVVKFPHRKDGPLYGKWMFHLTKDKPDATRIRNAIYDLKRSPSVSVTHPPCQTTRDLNLSLKNKNGVKT